MDRTKRSQDTLNVSMPALRTKGTAWKDSNDHLTMLFAKSQSKSVLIGLDGFLRGWMHDTAILGFGTPTFLSTCSPGSPNGNTDTSPLLQNSQWVGLLGRKDALIPSYVLTPCTTFRNLIRLHFLPLVNRQHSSNHTHITTRHLPSSALLTSPSAMATFGVL